MAKASAELTFETLQFRDAGESSEVVDVTFQRIFGFSIPKTELKRIAPFTVAKNSITFGTSEKSARMKFSSLLAQHFTYLKNKLNGKETIYVHQNSGIPLIGTLAFGIIDRNTNLIEVRPVTSCNIRCTYCSVDEDVRPTDFVVEADYLVQEFKKVAEWKQCKDLDCHINSQGEPFLYNDMVALVKGIAGIKGVTNISINTNGTLLTPANIKALAEAGLTRINLSLNAYEPELAKKIADAPYNIAHILEMAREVTKHMNLLIAPVLIPGQNEAEMGKIIEFAKTLKNPDGKMPVVGIQNFLWYKYGRNPAESMPWENFYSFLRDLEQKHGVKLIVDELDFNIEKTKQLPKPFQKGDVVKAKVISAGRLHNETLCVAKDRCIGIIAKYDPSLRGKTINVKIVKDKHNIYVGERTGK